MTTYRMSLISAGSILLYSTVPLSYHIRTTLCQNNKGQLTLITGEKVGYLVAAEVEGLQAGVQVQLARVHSRQVVVGQVCTAHIKTTNLIIL
jgi:hypothetical protein